MLRRWIKASTSNSRGPWSAVAVANRSSPRIKYYFVRSDFFPKVWKLFFIPYLSFANEAVKSVPVVTTSSTGVHDHMHRGHFKLKWPTEMESHYLKKRDLHIIATDQQWHDWLSFFWLLKNHCEMRVYVSSYDWAHSTLIYYQYEGIRPCSCSSGLSREPRGICNLENYLNIFRFIFQDTRKFSEEH